MDKKYEVIKTEIKSTDEKSTLDFIGTDDTLDRDGEILTNEGWSLKNYKKNPVFLWGHNYRELPIGKSIRTVASKEDGLKFRIKFTDEDTNPFGHTVFKMYKEKFLNAVSVGFMPDKDGRDFDSNTGTLTTHKKELWELSAVPVPSNPNALMQNSVKSAFHAKVLNNQEYENFLKAIEDFKELENSLKFNECMKYPFLKPFPNEHSCRLKRPGNFDSFARENCGQKSDGKCIDVIFGIKGDTSEIQALRYPIKTWTESQARSHCEGKDGILFEPATGGKDIIEFSECECEGGIDKIEKIDNNIYEHILSIKAIKGDHRSPQLSSELIDRFSKLKI